ncbi:10 kDa chaperonin 2 [Stieleria maiorica]|uniref:Co-chaperonin GroES n=1 Tax=Stieleria maiorica TaxID=2795974 RepID=A0A5B9MGE4_9BACT|nr:co-chaperone GroES [Stieleria maiorica]QEF99176.1 10 kDa chaperonin 2 [Stieleria maiorica]
MATATKSDSTTNLKLKPLADRVVCQRDEAEETTAGGIVLPDSAKEKVNRARVIAVGPGKRDDNGTVHPLSVRPGDHVLLNKYGGDEFEVDALKYTIVKESDILAVIEN